MSLRDRSLREGNMSLKNRKQEKRENEPKGQIARENES
jgi:hypothetical protein